MFMHLDNCCPPFPDGSVVCKYEVSKAIIIQLFGREEARQFAKAADKRNVIAYSIAMDGYLLDQYNLFYSSEAAIAHRQMIVDNRAMNEVAELFYE